MDDVRDIILDALETARHELTWLNGMYAADGAAPSEKVRIDTDKAIAKLDAALARYEPPARVSLKSL